MTTLLNILLTNDDGIQAPGLLVLENALKQIADITVVAPDRNRSGASNSLTLDNPIRCRQLENGFVSVEGTPTDCVHIALTGLLKKMPDMIISGINAGANMGEDVFYSGTVAAAMEGCFLGVPAIALSLVGSEMAHYATAAKIAKQLALRLHAEPLPMKTILNVNVPDLPYSGLRNSTVTRLGTRHMAEPVVLTQDPRGKPVYWIGPPGPEQDAGVGTDFYAVKNQQVSITPLQLDLTHYSAFAQLEEWVGDLTQVL